jgi:uncharacterized protein (TIGR04255 family)
MSKLKNAPVFLTAAQVTHNTVLAMDDFIADLQEGFRKLGYSDYQEIKLKRFELATEAAGNFQLKSDNAKQHVFCNPERSECFVVEPTRIYFCVTQYDVFEVFCNQFKQGLSLLHEKISLAYSESVSMRMLDAILPAEGQSLALFLVPELCGLPNRVTKPGWSALHSGQESTFEKKSQLPLHKLAVRTFIYHGELALPPDILTLRLKLPSKFSGINAVHAVLDCDAAVEERSEQFDIDGIIGRLRALKDDLRELFLMSVTSDALEEWGK